MTEIGLTPGPLGVPGTNWYWGSSYYVHADVLYLEGGFASPEDASLPVTSLVMTGIPAILCPVASVTVTIPVISPNMATPGIGSLPSQTDVTVHPTGDITLASLPPYINDTPLPTLTYFSNLAQTTTAPQFPRPLTYRFVVSGMSWPIGPGSAEEGSWVSLAPYVGDAFTNIDAEILRDRARVSLRGRVQANRIIANARIPPDYGDIPEPARNFPLLRGLPSTYTDAVDNGTYIAINTPRFGLTAAELSPATDSDSDASAQDPSEWKLYPLTDAVCLGWRGRRDGSNAHDALVTLPMMPGFTWTQLANDGDGSGIFAPGASLMPVPGQPDLNAPEPYSFVNHGEGTVGGVLDHTASFNVPVGSTLSNWSGTYRSKQNGPTWSVGASYHDASIALPTDSPRTGTLSVSGDLSDDFGDWEPAPDYVMCLVVARQSVNSGENFFGPQDAGGTLVAITPDTGTIVDGAGTSLAIGGLPMGTDGYYALGQTSDLLAGYIRGGDYTGDPDNPWQDLLWSTATAPHAVEVSMSWYTASNALLAGSVTIRLNTYVVPFWIARRNYIMSGDVIDLTGTGWGARYGQTLQPGVVITGSADTGIRRRGRIIGGAGRVLAP